MQSNCIQQNPYPRQVSIDNRYVCDFSQSETEKYFDWITIFFTSLWKKNRKQLKEKNGKPLRFTTSTPGVSLSNLLVHTYPTHIRIISVTQDSSGSIRNWACVEVVIWKTIFTIQLTVVYLNLASTRFPVHSVFKNFHYGERIPGVSLRKPARCSMHC